MDFEIRRPSARSQFNRRQGTLRLRGSNVDGKVHRILLRRARAEFRSRRFSSQ